MAGVCLLWCRLRSLNIVPHVVVTPTIKLSSLLLHNCNFGTVMNCNLITVFSNDLRQPVERVVTHRLKTSDLA